jgi:hypothetical protein
MIKMLNQGGTRLGAVRRHINYLDRGGKLEIETDDGEPLRGKGRLWRFSMIGIWIWTRSGLRRI